MAELMRQSAELHIGDVVVVDPHQVFAGLLGFFVFRVLWGWRLSNLLDGAGTAVTSIEVMMLDALALYQGKETHHAFLGDITARLEEFDVCGKWGPLGILNVINQSHWPERPQYEQRAGIPFRTAIEALSPVVCRRGVAQSRLLDLQQQRVEGREVPELHHEVQEHLVVRATVIEARVLQQLIQQ
ncbi:hypothetical protein D3C72_1315780 [compost metagenome]